MEKTNIKSDNRVVGLEQRIMAVLKTSPVPMSAMEIAAAVAARFPGVKHNSVITVARVMVNKKMIIRKRNDEKNGVFVYSVPRIRDAITAIRGNDLSGATSTPADKPSHKTDAIASPQDQVEKTKSKGKKQSDNPVIGIHASVSIAAANAIAAIAKERHWESRSFTKKSVSALEGEHRALVIRSLTKDFMLARPWADQSFVFVKETHPFEMHASLPQDEAWMEKTRTLHRKTIARLAVVRDAQRISERREDTPVPSTIFWHTAIVWGLINSLSDAEQSLPDVSAFLEYAKANYAYEGRDIIAIYRDIYSRNHLAGSVTVEDSNLHEHSAENNIAEVLAPPPPVVDCVASETVASTTIKHGGEAIRSLGSSVVIEKDPKSQMVHFQCDFSVPESVGALIAEMASQILDQWTAPDVEKQSG